MSTLTGLPESHIYTIALYFMHYNFVMTLKTLAYPYPRPPAMAADIADHIWSIEEIVKLAKAKSLSY